MSGTTRIRQFLAVNRWLLVAVILCAAAVYISFHYVTQYMQQQAQQQRTVATAPVLVLTTATSAFEPIVPGDVTIRRYPATLVPPGALSSVASLTGAWTTEALGPGVPIVGSEIFYPKTSNVIAARINPHDMAVDLPLGSSDAVDGLINPGDHISLFTQITPAGSSNPVVEDFMNNIPVLAVNGSLAPAATPTTGQGLTLILALPPERIAALLFAESHGTLIAALDAPHSQATIPVPYSQKTYLTPIP